MMNMSQSLDKRKTVEELVEEGRKAGFLEAVKEAIRGGTMTTTIKVICGRCGNRDTLTLLNEADLARLIVNPKIHASRTPAGVLDKKEKQVKT